MSVPPALQIDRLSLSYRGGWTLTGIEARLAKGRAVAVLGRNGAGKSTLLRALMDLHPLGEGNIRWFGKDHCQAEARRGIAYLPERFSPPPYVSGREWLQIAFGLQGYAYDAGRVARECSAFALDERKLDRSVQTYSRGMVQKLGLIGSCTCARRALVLDEPESGLDPHTRLLLKRRLTALVGSAVTVIYSTHLLVDVHHICTDVLVLDGDHAIFFGPVDAFLNRYRVATVEKAFASYIENSRSRHSI